MNIDLKFFLESLTCGIYILLLFVAEEVTLTIGKLGKRSFPKGYYTYTGSAFGKGATSLKNRIGRHLEKDKQKFWHIDYLLAEENVFVEAIIVAEISEKRECETNQRIKTIRGAEVTVEGFGSSDCKKNCESHLLHFSEINNADFFVQKLVRHLQSASSVCAHTVFLAPYDQK